MQKLIGGDAPVMLFAEDATFSTTREIPEDFLDPTVLLADRNQILNNLRRRLSFALTKAHLDTTGFAERFFDHMFGPVFAPRPLNDVEFHEDPALNSIAENHVKVGDYCDLVLNAPGSGQSNRHRLHQALEAANWDINQIGVIDDLGVAAFNDYSFRDMIFSGQDMGNGLTLTVHGLQHSTAIVKDYCYDEKARKYSLTLTCFLYDAFGIDTDDLRDFGAAKSIFHDIRHSSNPMESLNEWARVGNPVAIAMNSWFLLQHKYGFAPLITRIVLEKEYEVYVG